MAGRSSRAGRNSYSDAVAIDMDALIRHRDHDRDRSGRRTLGMPREFTWLELVDFFVDLLSESAAKQRRKTRGAYS